LSKTFGFGKRNGNGLQSQANQSGAGGEGDQANGGRGAARGAGGGRAGGGGRGGGGGGGRGGGGVMGGGPGGFGPGQEGSRFTLTFTLNVTNPLNHVNFGQYSGRLGSQFFGISNSALPARQMDFNVRFGF
ncbi:MAG TPA: hypothetical protein VE715_09275, partial [Blastocatellia bacterium]|nr:hypothetical protein [Blastocatellia bacterium]